VATPETVFGDLGEACQKTGWEVHAYCLMGNHFRLVVETPQPNLVAEMRWLLGDGTLLPPAPILVWRGGGEAAGAFGQTLPRTHDYVETRAHSAAKPCR